jgi:1,4-dihydroxy-6-naphthoate synthase
MSKPALTIGYSPCPNDTFIFYALMHGEISLRHARFSTPRLEDVETLNKWAFSGRLDVTKLSFHALGHVRDKYTMLKAGAALGRGCGPLLVTKADHERSDPSAWKIAVPGRYTTAALLLRLFLPEHSEMVIMRFDAIMDAVRAGEVDGGVIIHESRFTFQDYGLVCVRDLGEWWEQDTGLPVPLGCIAARKSLGTQVIEETEQAVAASIRWAYRHQDQCASYIKQHAQELDDQVVADHIKLYVNNFSMDLGDEGGAAVKELLRRGADAGIFADRSEHKRKYSGTKTGIRTGIGTEP